MKKKTEIMRLCVFAILCALSIVIGRFLIVPLGNSNRITFGDIPAILASVAFGIPGGAVVAVLSDILGCLLVPSGAVNPIITAGQCIVALTPAIIVRMMKIDLSRTGFFKTFLLLTPGFLTGSIIVKSIGLYVYYKTPLIQLVLRIPTTLLSAVVAALALTVLFHNAEKAIISCGGRTNFSAPSAKHCRKSSEGEDRSK